MAPYGGPVEPRIALGSFPADTDGDNPEYRLASAVILTFLIKNNVNKTLLRPAMKWELRYMFFLLYGVIITSQSPVATS